MTALSTSAPSPQISVIVPVYNVEKYLWECLDSVISQTFADLEIIVIDDGSTDGSLAIAKEYEAKDPRIHVYHQNNIGLGETRNRGIGLATGKYLYCIDSDDFIDPDWLEALYNKAEETGADVVFGEIMSYWEDGRKPQLMHDHSPLTEGSLTYDDSNEEDFYRNIYFAGYFATAAWSKIERADFVCEHNLRYGDNRRIFGEDSWFNLQLLHARPRVAFVHGVHYYYRRRATSIMNSPKKDILKREATMVADYSRFIQGSRSYYLEKKILDGLSMTAFVLEVNNVLITGGRYRDFREGMKDVRQYPEFLDALCSYNRDRAYLYETSRQHRILNRWISFCYGHHMDGLALRTVWGLYRTMKKEGKYS